MKGAQSAEPTMITPTLQLLKKASLPTAQALLGWVAERIEICPLLLDIAQTWCHNLGHASQDRAVMPLGACPTCCRWAGLSNLCSRQLVAYRTVVTAFHQQPQSIKTDFWNLYQASQLSYKHLATSTPAGLTKQSQGITALNQPGRQYCSA